MRAAVKSRGGLIVDSRIRKNQRDPEVLTHFPLTALTQQGGVATPRIHQEISMVCHSTHYDAPPPSPLGGLGVAISPSLISLFNWPGTVGASVPVVWPHARLT